MGGTAELSSCEVVQQSSFDGARGESRGPLMVRGTWRSGVRRRARTFGPELGTGVLERLMRELNARTHLSR